MCRKVEHAILLQTAAFAERFYPGFGRLIAEVNLAFDGCKTIRHQAQFGGGFGQRREVLELLDVGRTA